MKWFVAKMVYRIISGDGNHQPQFDHQFKLIAAESTSIAFAKATGIGLRECLHLENGKAEMVKWQFLAIDDLAEINHPGDGTELFSIIEEPEDANTFLEKLNFKSNHLHQQFVISPKSKIGI